jgi:ATP-dependent DNA helicase RecQ
MTLASLFDESVARSEIKDRLSLRIVDCISDIREGNELTTSKDLTILIRQWIRRKDVNSNNGFELHGIPKEVFEVLDAELTSFGMEKHALIDNGVALTANPWIPDWVRGASERNPVDRCSGEIVRRSISSIETDSAFKNLTGYQFYKSEGQFAACQMVRSMKDGSATVVMLPTGSGKTEVALSMIENLVNVHPSIRDKSSIVSVLVVPYVSLIKDLDRRFVDLYQKQWKGTSPLTFSYTYDTDSSQLESLLNRINYPDGSNIPGIVITSPESFVGRFREELRNWAISGRLGSLVFDEAHLVYQSGVGFRLDFRELPLIRNELNEVSPSGCKPRTLLMSATIGKTELKYFIENFGPVENLALIDAAILRSEPDIFISKKLSSESREKYLIEALHNLPRPAIIYVTRPKDAKTLFSKIREWGFGRVRCVIGETSSKEREEVLNSLRTGDSRSKCDLVVANSAFGLGIDCEEIRSVIHYCLPESVDRWYQEIGRGGRDGKSSVGLLITEGRKDTGDWNQAISNVPKALLIETLNKRWDTVNSLHVVSQLDDSRILLDLRTPSGEKFRRDWNEFNGHSEYGLKWNRTIIYALQEMGLIELYRPSSQEIDQIRSLGSTHFDWVVMVKKQGFDLGAPHFAARWTEFRDKLSEPFENQLERMFKISSGELGPCEGIKSAYEMPIELADLLRPCLQVESCKDNCGHCSRCFEKNVARSRSKTTMPFMSTVSKEYVDRSMKTFIDDLRNFWRRIPEWRELADPDVNILPIAQFDLEKEKSKLFEEMLIRNQFWIYDTDGKSVDRDLLNYIRPQVPGAALIRSDSIGGDLVKCFYRKESFRKDLGVPLLLLDMERDHEPDIETKFDSPILDWQIPKHFNWVKETTEMIRKLVDGRYHQ